MMNQNMQKLREQALQYVGDNHRIQNPNAITQQEIDQRYLMYEEKFAELIVKECADILSQNNPCQPGTTIMYSFIQDEYFDKGWQVAVETKSNQIKKHFGVEE